MNEERIVDLPYDEWPKDGVWRDDRHELHDLTEEEITAGNYMGEDIDLHDDGDNGFRSAEGLPRGSIATAMAEAKRLQGIMKKYGVECSIELTVGRPNNTGWGNDWYSKKIALMNHHTSGSIKGNTPSLRVCKEGRDLGTATELPGPLCNGYMGRDWVYRIFTMGLANHPGQGGPMELAGYRIQKDSGRHVIWGTEFDWPGDRPWPEKYREMMGRANSALLEWMARPVEVSIEHKTWAGPRKDDRYGYTAATGQAEIRKWMRAEEDDMYTDQDRERDNYQTKQLKSISEVVIMMATRVLKAVDVVSDKADALVKNEQLDNTQLAEMKTVLNDAKAEVAEMSDKLQQILDEAPQEPTNPGN